MYSVAVHRDFIATNYHSYTVFTVEYFENGEKRFSRSLAPAWKRHCATPATV